VGKNGRRTADVGPLAGSLGRPSADVARRITPTAQTVAALLDEIATRLLGAVEEPVRESRDLLAALLDVPRHWPLLHENKWVEADTWRRALASAAKRASGAPLAYAVGRASFRSLTLDVDERVLIPRPETELLVDLVLNHARPGGVAVDVGTGSGAIAIALAMEGEFERVLGTDVSVDALDVARTNAARLGAGNVEFRAGDLLETSDAGPMSHVPAPMSGLRVVVSNPPYISLSEVAELPPSVRDWEPAIALYSAENGMAATARLVRQAASRLEPGGLLALEVDSRRAALAGELVASDQRYCDVRVHLDLTGRERFILASRREHE
jgi:release factor glutamine methyltransferase